MDIQTYAGIFKAAADAQGIRTQAGMMPGANGTGTTYDIECQARREFPHASAIHCAFTENSPVLLIVPQITAVPSHKRAEVLELCNEVANRTLHPRFIVNEDGFLELRAWSIFIAFDEEDFSGNIAMEVLELYEEINDVLEDYLDQFLQIL